jgi:hypothetical protein
MRFSFCVTEVKKTADYTLIIPEPNLSKVTLKAS